LIVIQSDKNVAVCSVHPSELATIQCMECVKAKIPVSRSFHCSPKCYSDSWGHHRALHARAASAVHENGTEDDELFGGLGSTGGLVGSTSSSGIHNASLSNGSALLNPPNVSERGGDETWYEVGRSKTYTPTADDVGYALKLECVAVDAATGIPVGPASTLRTSLVIPAPSPTPRRMIPINAVNGIANLELEGRTVSFSLGPILKH
jgi:CCR4-NOT transcription complex subunit 6